MDNAIIEKEQAAIIAQLKEFVPTLRPFFDLDSTLAEYSRALYKFPVSDVHLERQTLVKKHLDQKLGRIFGADYQKDLNIELKPPLVFNIADHHQVLNQPFLVSPNVISSISKFFQSQKPPAIVVISSGDVPPNNYFSQSGFQFYGRRVPIFSTSEREYCSYYLPKRNFDFVQKLQVAKRWTEFNSAEQEFLIRERDKLQGFNFSRCENYLDQISVIVRQTWPSLFEKSLRPTLPELIYITQEELVTECLIELLSEDNMISACLFDPDFRQKVLDTFRGNVVAWNEATHKGTHFFWRKYPGQPRSLRMYVKDSALVPEDPRFTALAVPLTREATIDLLRRREIYPSLFMIFGVLNFYAGIKPLTGYGSLVYLDRMKQSWLTALSGSRFESELEHVKLVDVTGFIAGLIAFFERIDGKLKTLYAYDMMYNGGVTRSYLERLFRMKFKELMMVSVADMYDYYCSKYIPEDHYLKVSIHFDDLAPLAFDWV